MNDYTKLIERTDSVIANALFGSTGVKKALVDCRDAIVALQARVEKAREALDIDGENDAHDNLWGAFIDLERQDADKVCLETIRRVMKQIAEVEKALKPKDRHTAALASTPTLEP